jgi:hypothetical protein
MQINLFTHEGCVNCNKVKNELQKILPEMGFSYQSVIRELDIDDPDVLADLIMLDTEQVPTLSLGSALLTGKEIMNEGMLRTFLSDQLKKNC